jgi:hypothetical protein
MNVQPGKKIPVDLVEKSQEFLVSVPPVLILKKASRLAPARASRVSLLTGQDQANILRVVYLIFPFCSPQSA